MPAATLPLLLLAAAAAAGFAAWGFTLRSRLAAARAGLAERDRRLRAASARLRGETESRREVSAALASMSDAVLVVGPDLCVLRINRSAGRLLSCRPEAARGRPLGEVAREVAIRELVTDTLAGEEVTDRDLRVAVADQPLDRPRRMSARTTVLRDHAGEPIGAVAVLRDVTQLRRLEGVRRDFVANVSHELRTPIASIKAAVETLLDAAEDDPATRGRFLGMAARHADRLDAIIEDLLTLARLEGGSGPVVLTTDWVGPVLSAARDTCRAAAEEAGVEVTLDVEPGLLARMQPSLVEQAAVNLIGNAVKYAAAGGRVAVTAAADADDASVRIRVTDRGPGIQPEHLPRLFERFYRADASRSRVGGGTGLGLSIVRHVAEACGGSVAVASRVGEGTTFTLCLQGPEAPERERGREGERERVRTAAADPPPERSAREPHA